MAEHFYSALILPPVFELACATPQAALYPADIGWNPTYCLCRTRALQLRASLQGSSGDEVKIQAEVCFHYTHLLCQCVSLLSFGIPVLTMLYLPIG